MVGGWLLLLSMLQRRLIEDWHMYFLPPALMSGALRSLLALMHLCDGCRHGLLMAGKLPTGGNLMAQL